MFFGIPLAAAPLGAACIDFLAHSSQDIAGGVTDTAAAIGAKGARGLAPFPAAACKTR